MENIEQILNHWEKDSVIDSTEPGKELIRIPILHNKYLTMLIKHKLASKKANFDYLRLKKIKWEYYNGKLSREELEEHGWEQFKFTLKSDITTYLESDIDLIRLLEKKIYHEEVITMIESIMKELNSRTYQLKDFISWEKFINGN
jgi:hypothetical protein